MVKAVDDLIGALFIVLAERDDGENRRSGLYSSSSSLRDKCAVGLEVQIFLKRQRNRQEWTHSGPSDRWRSRWT